MPKSSGSQEFANNLPYGQINFMGSVGVQNSLIIAKDTLRRITGRLHGLQLKNGGMRFPIGYISGLAAFKNEMPDNKLSMRTIAENYARTAAAHCYMESAERDFAEAVDSSIYEVRPDLRIISATAVAHLLDYNRAHILNSWALRPDLLPPVNLEGEKPPITGVYFAEQAFRDFYTWQRPIIRNPTWRQ